MCPCLGKASWSDGSGSHFAHQAKPFLSNICGNSQYSQTFNKVHLRVLNSLSFLPFFTCVNYLSASQRGVGKMPALTIAI